MKTQRKETRFGKLNKNSQTRILILLEIGNLCKNARDRTMILIMLEKSIGQIESIQILIRNPIQNALSLEIQIPEFHPSLRILSQFQVHNAPPAMEITSPKNASTQPRTLQYHGQESQKFGVDFLKHSQNKNDYMVLQLQFQSMTAPTNLDRTTSQQIQVPEITYVTTSNCLTRSSF